ncbi:MAG TPA: hypothetical protein VE988_04395 [Gemmataceae bacterium]|nr:hypothetical protein [Gemmataceae bacterium]
MRAFIGCVALAVTAPAFAAGAGDDNAKKHLKSDNYTVTWGTPATYAADAELDIGYGSGHGFSLGWMRFKPTKDRVDIVSILLDPGRQPYESKWPPDRAPVVVQYAQMKPDAYAALLRDLAVVDAAKLKPVERNGFSSSSNDFWVHARLAANKKTLIDFNWAGYKGSLAELEYARPLAAVDLAREAVEKLELKEHTLTDEERGWASTKFARDWKRFKGLEGHWWVRERSIITIGVVGDATALPTLRDILGGDPKDHDVYHAINAITRLVKKDVCDKPVEEMDVEKTRRKILELLAPLQKEESAKAEKLYQAMANKLIATKTFQCSFELAMEFDGGKAKLAGWAAFAEGNKSRLKADGDIFGANWQIETVSDGKQTRVTMAVAGKPPQSTTSDVPAKANDFLREAMARGGIFVGLFPKPKKTDRQTGIVSIEQDQKERTAQEIYQISDFKLGEKEMIGDRETQKIDYVLTINKEEQASLTLWLDPETSLPLKRNLLMGKGKDQLHIVETYTNYRINESLDSKQFDLPK